jgi:hypothetical protein
MKKFLVTLLLVFAIAAIPPVPVQAQPEKRPEKLVGECITVVIVVAVGVIIVFKIIIPLCKKINSNRNWMLSNVATLWATVSQGGETNETTLEAIDTLATGGTWYGDTYFTASQLGNVAIVTAYRNGVAVMTNSAAADTNGIAWVDFTSLPPTTNAPSRFFRLAN